MNVYARLALFGAGLVAVFVVMFLAGRALVPAETVADWTREAKESDMDHGTMSGNQDHVRGLSVEQDGFRLADLQAPAEVDEQGSLSFRIVGTDGNPLTDFAVNHEKRLHLIVVRSDGAAFRHAHPSLDASTGEWRLPWSWEEGGSYRVFADFRPAGEESEDITLGHDFEVAGRFEPAVKLLSRNDRVDGFDVSIAGDLKAGEQTPLTVKVERQGRPESHLEPYLGAFGHLVALREGDLAYLHVHPEHGQGEQTEDSDHEHAAVAGPEIGFLAEAPTTGRYLLYLDFKVNGEVHTAEFVLEAK